MDYCTEIVIVEGNYIIGTKGRRKKKMPNQNAKLGVPHVEEASGGWTTPQNREDIMSASSPYRISGLTMLWMSFA